MHSIATIRRATLCAHSYRRCCIHGHRMSLLQRRSSDAGPARDSASVAVLAESLDDKPSATAASAAERRQSFRVHSMLKGQKRIGTSDSLSIVPHAPVEKGSLVLLLGSGADNAPLRQLTWTAIPIHESAYGYIFREPTVALPQSERLKYFARYLENRNPLVTDDALQEFAHASFDDTVQAAPRSRWRRCAPGSWIRKFAAAKRFLWSGFGIGCRPY